MGARRGFLAVMVCFGVSVAQTPALAAKFSAARIADRAQRIDELVGRAAQMRGKLRRLELEGQGNVADAVELRESLARNDAEDRSLVDQTRGDLIVRLNELRIPFELESRTGFLILRPREVIEPGSQIALRLPV